VNGNPRDGYLDRLIFRRVSAPLTRLLLRTPLSPTDVTVIGTVAGVTGGLALALSWPLGAVLAVGLLACSSVLDCSDGELARLRQRESRLGHVLDVTGDTLVHGALFAGIALVLGRDGAFPDRRTLIALATGVAGAFAAITWSEATEKRRRRVACWENRVLDGVLAPLTTRDWYLFPLGAALAGRLDMLLTGAAVGAHVFWISVVVLVVRALRRSSA
jgi:phosphatidylglycerophosphate synthase